MRIRATKAEAKVLEKLARSAAAIHLHEGLVYRRNYTAHEAASYWRTYKYERHNTSLIGRAFSRA